MFAPGADPVADSRLQLFVLADRFRCTVGEIQQRMTTSEQLEWLAYFAAKKQYRDHGSK